MKQDTREKKAADPMDKLNDQEQDKRLQKDLVRDRFTKTAEVFGRYAVENRGKEVESLARALKVKSSDQAVDLACGAGTLALRFARRVRWICGIDLTSAMLDRARQGAVADRLSNIAFAVGDAHSLPFPTASLDIAAMTYALHHMHDPSDVIREMARVVRRGGRVGMIDIHVSENEKVAELANRIERIRDDSHTCSLPLSEFKRLFSENGLRIVAIDLVEEPRDFDHWMYVAGWKPEDPQYVEAHDLMEATVDGDTAGFRPQFAPADSIRRGHENRERQILRIVNTITLIAAEKE